MASAKPGASLSTTASVASGVRSLGESPVPPEVRMMSSPASAQSLSLFSIISLSSARFHILQPPPPGGKGAPLSGAPSHPPSPPGTPGPTPPAPPPSPCPPLYLTPQPPVFGLISKHSNFFLNLFTYELNLDMGLMDEFLDYS